MKILSDEFKRWLKGMRICRFIGHRRSGWFSVEGGVPVIYNTGRQAKHCLRCGKMTNERTWRIIAPKEKLGILEEMVDDMKNELGIIPEEETNATTS